MILTLTPNPSIDRTLEVERLARGQVIRASAARVDAGGKGVNVSRALVKNGHQTRAVLPSGGVEGAQLEALLSREGVEVVPVAITGSVRTNVSLVEPDGTVTKLNDPGPTLSEQEQDELADATLAAARHCRWVVLSGSLPAGVDPDFYSRLIVRLHQADVRVALDTSDASLELALPAGPHLVKPNRSELAAVTGQTLHTFGDVIEAARLVRDKGAEVVLVSLGADGAVLVDDCGATRADAPVRAPRSAVGAGDAMLAGFLAAGGSGSGALCEAVAWGAAATALPGSRMPAPADIDRQEVLVHGRLDPDRALNGEDER